MDQFTEKMLDHARSPRNLGVIEEPDGAGHVESDCGDWVLMTLKLDPAGAIGELRFAAQGCGSAIASASVLTELAQGKTLTEAASITVDDVVTYIGGLPEHKGHCSRMSHAAFIAAVESAADHRRAETSGDAAAD
jgi:NifU-like protein involved in Fe-S cluster formation